MSASDSPGSAEVRRPYRLSAQTLTHADGCPRRLWLRQHVREEASAPSEHDLVLREVGQAHEKSVASRFAEIEGPVWQYGHSHTAAAERTAELLRTTRKAIYQPALLSADGLRSGVPDFLYWEGDGLVVLEAKLAHRPESRPDFALQLAHYGAILRESLGIEPIRYEIVDGNSRTVVMQPASEETYQRILHLASSTLEKLEEPDVLLGHSKCSTCSYYSHCWERAVAQRRIEIIPEVQARHVPELHAMGVRDVTQLAAVPLPRLKAILSGATAHRAKLAAQAWRDGAAAWIEPARLPAPPIVWFDLEGDSRGLHAEVPIYLWGIALEDGVNAPHVESLFASFEPGGDREAWERFVGRASEILNAHPNARWMHWDTYEVLWIDRYHARYGSPDGFVARMKAVLFDLKRVLDRCVRLPLRSYSVKHVAPWMGFEWRNPEAGSEWSVAQYHHARRSADSAERDRLLAAVAEYNADDLWAMRAIWMWLREHEPERTPGAL